MDLDDVSMDLDMNDEDELEFQNEIIIKIQAHTRGMLGRMKVRRIINERFEKIRDPRRNVFFYYDKLNDTSSWLKPSMLKDNEDILEIAPTYTDDEAAVMITTIWRQLCGLRKVQRLYATTVEKIKGNYFPYFISFLPFPSSSSSSSSFLSFHVSSHLIIHLCHSHFLYLCIHL